MLCKVMLCQVMSEVSKLFAMMAVFDKMKIQGGGIVFSDNAGRP